MVMPAPVIVHEKWFGCFSLTPDNFSTSLICTCTIGKEGGEEGSEEGARPGGTEGARSRGVLGDTGGEEGDSIAVRRKVSSPSGTPPTRRPKATLRRSAVGIWARAA